MTTHQSPQYSDNKVRPMAIKDILSFLSASPNTPPSESDSKAAHEMLEQMLHAYHERVPAIETVEWIRAFSKQQPLPRSKDQNALLFVLDVAPRLRIKHLSGFYTRVLTEIPNLYPRSIAAQRVRKIKDFTPKTRIACWQALRKCLQEWEGKSPDSVFSSAARLGFPSALIVGDTHASEWISNRVRTGDLGTSANAVNAILYWAKVYAKKDLTDVHQTLSASLYQDCMYRLLREIDLTEPPPEDQRILLRTRLILAMGHLVTRPGVRFFSTILAHAFGTLSMPEHDAILKSAHYILSRFNEDPKNLFPLKIFQKRDFHKIFHRHLFLLSS